MTGRESAMLLHGIKGRYAAFFLSLQYAATHFKA
ncbi:hypothetical protein SAMN02744778_02318 [Pantoea sp. GL120224-02]|jgi:hypothetical protein|nr:hypothetical protein SAMN02744778_02318 [Pantoea sp. GL120224-02]